MRQLSVSLLLLLFSAGCVSGPVPFPTKQSSLASSQPFASFTPTLNGASILLTKRVGTVIALQTASATPLPASDPTENPTPEPTLTPSFTLTPIPLKGVIFSKVYGQEGHSETAYSILSTIDGGYLITGQANHGACLIRKLDSTGEMEWEYSLGSELQEEFQITNGLFTCWSARQMANGDYVVIGTGRNEMGSQSTNFLLRLGDDGAKKSTEEFRWRRGMSPHLDKEGNLFWSSMFGLYGEFIETSDHGYIVVGMISGDAPGDSVHVFRADANGNYLWERNLCQDKSIKEAWEKKIVCSNRNMWDAIQSQDGGFVILGEWPGIWLIKMDANGNVEWTKSYHGSNGHAVTQTPDGGFLIAGGLNKDGLLIKTDASGNFQWQKTFGENEYGVFNKITVNSKGDIIVMGSKQSNTWLLSIDLDDLE